MTRASIKFVTAAALAGTLVSCAHRSRPFAEAAPAPPAAPPRPVLAAAYQGVVVPPTDADGHYRTINAGIGDEQALWHVRAALNVAAIGCRGPENAALVAAYNRLLTGRKAALAKANKTVEAQFRKRGSGWQDAHDRYMTQLYNFFSMPQATAAFCRTAAAIAPRAADTEASALPGFAPTALMQLEAPMIAVYQSIDGYKMQLADWDARYGRGSTATRVAAAAPVAATQVAMADAKPAKAKKPKLDYARIDVVLAWEPSRGVAVALR
jgi:hypothetical protein